MQNTDYKNLTDDDLFVIMDEENFLQSTHFENIKQLVKIDSEFKERFLKIQAEYKSSGDWYLVSEYHPAFPNNADFSKRVKVAYQNLKSRGIL